MDDSGQRTVSVLGWLTHIDPVYLLSGLGVGFLVGMTGVGGGSLMTPLLVLLFGVHSQTAVGTDLLFAAVTKSVGTSVHGFSRTIDWAVVRRLASGSVPASAGTLLWLHSHGGLGPDISRMMAYVLGSALLLTAGSLFFRPWLHRIAGTRRKPLPPGLVALLTVLFGICLGMLVSLSSVGAGAIGVTVLIALYPELPMVRIVGSDVAHAVPLTLIAGLGHWMLGAVDTNLLLSLLTGSLPGVIVGALLSSRIPADILRPVLGCILTVVGLRLLF
ncbi:Permease [Granulibacter bethesdensis]|uniref:Probable membrane transporter protein n=1 Tax=Granulibacter bethesdensis TaxID=364410 RepID=A0AAC9KDD1_9PROT|nr:sulfite exporter TauE/SafE family protein [Granulibacter bethesdensis]APH53925.1 Permease [Granulibacter bethesdensis]APH61505.1 Permease [Granulibacter bethesdensis]